MASTSASRRLAVLMGQVEPVSAPMAEAIGGTVASPLSLGEVAAASAGPGASTTSPGQAADGKFCPKEMRKFLDRTLIEFRDQVQEVYATDPLFRIPLARIQAMPMEMQREITLQRMYRLRDLGFLRDVKDDKERFIAFGEVSYYGDLNVCVRMNGAHISLYCGAILNLGTEKHHRAFLPGALSLQYTGCFALTELGHGSNVQGIETTITYDAASGEFVVHSPTELSQKFWIGGAVSATYAVVFGQLWVGGENRGVHAVIVPLRTADGARWPGVTVADCGHKEGLNGVDNGRIWFDHVRVPRDNLLDRFSQVRPDGTFVSELRTPTERFTRHVGELVGGRVFLSTGANNIAKVALATAVRYGLTRRQFVEHGSRESLILDYPLHQRRLFPFVAAAYVYAVAGAEIKNIWRSRDAASIKMLHVLAAGLKPVVTWHAVAAIQAARECCGGNGFGTFAKIAALRQDCDVWLTFEGDNFVLLQQVSRFLLKEFQHQMATGTFAGALSFMDIAARTADADAPVAAFAFQRAVFAQRAATLMRASAAKLQAQVSEKPSLMAAWNASTDVTTDLSVAYVELTALDWFQAALDNAAAELRPVLTMLRSLYALWAMYNNAAFYRSTETAFKRRAEIGDEISRLCAALRPHARALVDSFGIRDELLGSIAGDWEKTLSRAFIPLHA